MTRERPLITVTWVAIVAALVVVAVSLTTGAVTATPIEWLLILSLALLVAALRNLGVAVSFGHVTFLPAAVLTGYLALGLRPTLVITVSGLIIGAVAFVLQRQESNPDQTALVAQALWPLPQAVISVLMAHTVYGIALAAPLPLRSISTLRDLLPIIGVIIVYLAFHNLLLFGYLSLRGLRVLPTIAENRVQILAVQLLPVALAPFSAVALGQLGVATFALTQLLLLALTIAVHQLVDTQQSLQRQVRQLSSFSAMNRALRTTLDLSALLENVYLQTRNLLNTRNLWIVLRKPGETDWSVTFAVEGGRRVQRSQLPAIDGLTDWVLTMRFPLLVDPIERAVNELQITNLPTDARSWMGVPMTASKRVLGCVVTWLEEDEQPGRRLDENDLDMFTSIAVQTGVALENALLYQEAQNHAMQLARLNEISTLMNASLNQDMVLRLVATSVIEVAGCDKAALYLSDPDEPDEDLVLTHAQGFSPEHIARAQSIAVPLSDDERRQTLDQGLTVSVPDINDARADVTSSTRTLAGHEGFLAYAYVPLMAQNRPIGILAVYYERPHEFTTSELELLETFANQAALAVANARIYQRVDEDLSRRIEQIVRVSEISRRLSSTLEMESVFDLIIDQAVDGCGADYAVLVLTEDPQLGNLTTSMELNMVAWRGFDRSKAVLAPHQVAESLVKSPVLAEGRSTLETRPAEQATGRPRSHMSVPIMIEGRVIGALALEAMQPQAFNDDDMAFVSQLAIQAATAIRNAQLYRRAETVRDRLNAILDASSDGMLMIDEQMRIVMTNTRMGDFWNFARGYENAPDERMMDDPLAVLGEGLGYKSGELRALVRYAMQNPNMPPQTDLTVVGGSPGEKQRFVERTAMPVRDERGAFIGLLLLFRDVTQEKELEEARENLTSMMVHDLRGPLTAVMTSMDLIQKAAGGGNRVINQSTETSKRAVRKLLHMVNDLLDLSRMSDGRLVVDASPTPIADLFDEAALELSPISQELNVMVQVEVPDDLPAAYADRGMVERVVLNLLDNALKYTDPGTLVTMRASQPDEHDGHLLIEIIDQGPGVPDDFKAVIFDRFKQIPGRRGRRHSAGIGLAFCRLAVEAHGGRIWVEDNPEGGSIFSFTLPTDKAPARNGATA